jgi:hypothetical protein
LSSSPWFFVPIHFGHLIIFTSIFGGIMKKYFILSVSTFLALVSLSCSQGFHGSNAPTPTPNNASGAPNDPSSPPAPVPGTSADWNNFEFSAQVAGGLNTHFQAVTVDKVAKTITITLPLPFDSRLLALLGSAPVPKVNGAVIALVNLADGTTALSVTVPLSHLVNPLSGLPTMSLPNGDKLPEMTNGAAPSTQLLLKGKLPISLYINEMSIGIFVNTPFDPSIATHVSLNGSTGNQVGGLYSIPYKLNQTDGGFYIVVNVPKTYTDLIRQNL